MRKIFRIAIIICFGLTACRSTGSDTAVANEIDLNLKSVFHWTPERVPLISAHRGGPYPGFPENCIETFQHLLDQMPAMIETDIERAGDGTLLMMHDETLDRTTTGSGPVNSKNWQELSKLKLVDYQGRPTSYGIPTLKEVLHWAKGKAILTLDVKRSVPFEEVIEVIEQESAENYVVMITYTLGAAQKVHRLHPDLMLSVTIRNQRELDKLVLSGIPLDQVLAFVGTSEPQNQLYDSLHELGISCILGTLGNLDRRALSRGDFIYEEFIDGGADIIATDRPIEVARALSKRWKLTIPSDGQLVAQ